MKALSSCNQTITSTENSPFFDACQLGKSHLLPFTASSSHASKPLDLIHADIWGPAPVLSLSNFKYYVLFLDDFSRFTWLFPLKQKSDIIQTFIQLKAMVENQFERKIKCFQTNMGGEFLSLTNDLLQQGIKTQYSSPHTSPQNGRAERKHRHVVETGFDLVRSV